MTIYAQPGTDGSVVSYKDRYENWIGGEWVPPVKGQYFENPSPVTGKTFCEVARGTAEDIELALDAAHAAAPAWGKTSVAERAVILNKIADRLAVVPGLADGEQLEVLLHPVGDLVEDDGALGHRRLPPGGGGGVGGVQRQLDVLGGAPGDLAERLAGHR